MSLIGDLSILSRYTTKKRRLQLVGLIVLMIMGAVADVLSLGALIPFMGLLANPDKVEEFPILDYATQSLGWTGENLLLPATILFCVAVIVASGMRLLVQYSNLRMINTLARDLGVIVYDRLLHQPYTWHIQQNSGQLIMLVNKVKSLFTKTIGPILNLFVSSITLGAILIFLFSINPLLFGSAFFGLALIYIAISRVVGALIRRNGEIRNTLLTERTKAVQEGVGGIRDILLDDIQRFYVRRFARLENGMRRADTQNGFLGPAPRFVLEALGMVGIAILAFVLSQGEEGLSNALPLIGVLALAAQRALPMAQQAYQAWALISDNQAMRRELNALLTLPQYTNQAAEPLPFSRNIEFANVSFEYPGTNTLVLQDINFSIKRGQRVGFIGQTGSGKSTTLDLIMGLLEPLKGQILVDGKELATATRKDWQSRIAHVPQAIYLSDASILENIAFGTDRENIDEALAHEAAERAQLAEFIERLSQGYNTPVGERGIRLSGGQRQRIGIARALYKQAEVLVLDEATSALDDATERAVVECVDGLSSELTILMIAHRVTTLRGCDLIIELQHGKINRTGSYAEICETVPSSVGYSSV